MVEEVEVINNNNLFNNMTIELLAPIVIENSAKLLQKDISLIAN